MSQFYLDFHEGQSPHAPRSPRRKFSRFDQVDQESGFLCKHCKAFVSSSRALSGVQNRNHCPYCLHSRHLDLYKAGDRLSACKSIMKPIGLTTKASKKKYGENRGELMLVHMCIECNSFSINRLAADDDFHAVADLFRCSLRMEDALQQRLKETGICIMDAAGISTLQAQLFGSRGGFSDLSIS
jgi:hypothetical protein